MQEVSKTEVTKAIANIIWDRFPELETYEKALVRTFINLYVAYRIHNPNDNPDSFLEEQRGQSPENEQLLAAKNALEAEMGNDAAKVIKVINQAYKAATASININSAGLGLAGIAAAGVIIGGIAVNRIAEQSKKPFPVTKQVSASTHHPKINIHNPVRHDDDTPPSPDRTR